MRVEGRTAVIAGATHAEYPSCCFAVSKFAANNVLSSDTLWDMKPSAVLVTVSLWDGGETRIAITDNDGAVGAGVELE